MMKISSNSKQRGIISILLLLFLLNGIAISKVNANSPMVNVVLFSLQENTNLHRSLGIDSQSIKVTRVISPSDPILNDFATFQTILDEADVIFMDRFSPQGIFLEYTLGKINGTLGSKGLVCFGFFGNETPTIARDISPIQASLLEEVLPVKLASNYNMSPRDTSFEDYKIQVSLAENLSSVKSMFTRDIPWASAPAIGLRTIVEMKSGSNPIVVSIDGQYGIFTEWRVPTNGGIVIYFSPEINEGNKPFVLWPYFNYLIYLVTMHTSGIIAESATKTYASWAYSPIPQPPQIAGWIGWLVIMWILTFGGLTYIKKKTPAYTKSIQSKLDLEETVSINAVSDGKENENKSNSHTEEYK